MKKIIRFWIPLAIALLALAITAYAADPTPQPNLWLEVGDMVKLDGLKLEAGSAVVVDGQYKLVVISANENTTVLDGEFEGLESGEYIMTQYADYTAWLERVDRVPPQEPPNPPCPPAC